MPITPEAFGSTIIAIGDFNPAIFSPDWLLLNGLIGDGDHRVALSMKNMLVSHQIAVCETEWFRLQVLPNQLSLASSGALTPAIKDLAEGILLLLPQTPVKAFGTNFHGHYPMANEADWHKVGDALAPKAIWRELFDSSEYFVGLANIQMKVTAGAALDLHNPLPDAVNIQIQPSNKVKPGVFLSLNDHQGSFAEGKDSRTPAERAAALIAGKWDDTWAFATKTFEELLTKLIAS